MKVRLKDGVVLFQVEDTFFLFPSRRSGVHLSFLITLSPKLASALQSQGQSAPNIFSENEQEKLQRLIRLGYVEEV